MMARKRPKGMYYLDLKKGPADANIHNPILEEGDKRFVESTAGKDAIHRLVTQFGFTEAEAIALIS